MIIPAVDIMGNKVVRLTQGRFDQVTEYSQDPLKVAQEFIAQGAQLLHVVDLDGARTGSPQNRKIIRALAKESMPLQLGGGIRTAPVADNMLSLSVRRIVLGTAAQPLTAYLSKKWGASRIGVAIDVKNGKTMVEGWSKSSCKPVEMAETSAKAGAGFLVATAVEKDGALQGPDVRLIRKLAAAVSIPVIASGGISTLSDLSKLKNAGASGVIIGKALYEGEFTLEEAMECWQSA